MKSIDKAVEPSAQTTRNVFKRNLTRFAAVLLAALAGLVAGPNAALDAAPQHHDQQPGFYRLKVGDLEVTALYDGTGVFDPHWLNGTKATMDGVVKALQEDPHMLDVVDMGFLVHTGKQLILVDAGAGTWWGGAALGRLVGSLRSAGYTPEEVDRVLVTHLHSDHVGGLQIVPLPGHTPVHTGYEFSSKGQKILFWGDIIHAQRVQLQHPEVTAIFDIDQTAAAATRRQLLRRLAREDVWIAAPHTSFFPALGRLRKEGSGYSWVPVVFTDQWEEK